MSGRKLRLGKERRAQSLGGTAIIFMVALGAAPQIYAASIGIQDSVFLMLLALVIFGPRRLPEIGRQIGKLMYEFRKVSNDFKFQMEEELRASEEAERQRKLQAALPPPAPAAVLETPVSTPVGQEAVTEAGMEALAEPRAAIEPEVTGPQAAAAPSIQIQPPSTGEQVAAARPFRAAIPAEEELSAPEIVTGTSDERLPGVSAETETHHG